MSDSGANIPMDSISKAKPHGIKVLLIEGNLRDARLVKEALAADGADKFTVDHVDQISQGFLRLEQDDIQVILLDLSLLDGSGLETVSRIYRAASYRPIIVLSHSDDEALARKVIREGAQDFLVKNQIDNRMLFHAIVHALERKKAEKTSRKDEERLAEENAIMAEIGRLISSTWNIEEVYERFADDVHKLIPFDRIAISILDMENQTTTIAYVSGTDIPIRRQGNIFPLANTVTEKVVQTRKGLIIQSENKEDILSKFPGLLSPFQSGLNSMMMLPLIFKKQIVALLNFFSSETNAYTENHLRLAEKVSAQIAGTIANNLLFIEQIRGEEALKKSEAKFEKLFHEAPVGYMELDKEGSIIQVNRTELAMLGYKAEEMIGQPIWNFVVEEEKARRTVKAKLSGLRETGQAFERNYKRKDGTTLPVMIDDAIIRDAEGQISGILSAFQDITAHKQSEEALSISEERFRTLFRGVPVGLYRATPGGDIIDANPAFVQMLGYPDRESLLATNATELYINPKTWLYWQTLVEKEGIVKGFQKQMRRLDGKVIWVEESAQAACSEKGEFLHYEGSLLDITERRQAEEALQKSEQRFRDLYDHAPLGYHEYDLEGRITMVNRTDLELLGYTSNEMIGKPIWEFHIDEAKDSVRQQVLAKLAGALPPGRSLKRSYRRKDGAILPVLIEDRLILDQYGQISGIRSTIQDITEMKKAEQERDRLQDQLLHSQKMEAIGQLAGGIAHDFNNLLTVIQGYTQLLLFELKDSDPLRGNIEEIQGAANRAAELTRQLLAFSRRQLMEMEVIDLNRLLNDLDKMLRRVIGEDIELAIVSDKTLGRIKGDAGQVEQIIVNLAVNARDAMPSGGKLMIETSNVVLDETYVRTHVVLAPGPYVMLSVSDTGVGMSPEIKERVFEPFFTTKDKGRGTGLGLSTVYGIVKQIGGHISLYSEPGRGTTFKIYFPKVDEPLSESKQTGTASELPSGHETILVVEDSNEVRKLATEILKRQGYQVIEASNGIDALKLCAQVKEPAHLLLTDVVMPQMGGKELSERIKAFWPQIRVLFTSGFTDNAIVHHGVLDPGVIFLQKPFSPATMARKVREALDRSR